MSREARVAAHERDARNRDVVWTVADGRNGRRWRELAVDASGAARSLVLETDGQGTWQRLELSGADGLLTLHPEGDGSIHGNVTSRAGVRHLSLGKVKPARIDIPGSLVAEAALCWAMTRQLRVGERRTIAVVTVAEPVTVALSEIVVERRTTATWELRDGDRRRLVELDEDGLPVGHLGADRWPLEA
ncbi:MAG TPA: hypothetical protein VKR30_11400 [Candidatus Limnocylindrales bacterium]|nr:hypothetical protein [Candidatus Limnocylindrales bacterium]